MTSPHRHLDRGGRCIAVCLTLLSWIPVTAANAADGLVKLKYNNPGLVVDLGVGLWAYPMPMDYDRDGDLDLVVVCSGKPSNGTYLFENTQARTKLPIFKPGVRIGAGMQNVQVSYVDGQPRVLRIGAEYDDFRANQYAKPAKLPVDPQVHTTTARIRANQWRYADYDGDGKQDLIVGIGDWTDYGWDDAFDSTGRWTNGPLHGYVYLLRNTGTNDQPLYAPASKVEAGGRPIDQFGMPSPNFADFDGDGDLDLICGEFVDKLTYYQNTGTRTEPQYAAGRLLQRDGQPIAMDACMINPVAVDWDGDGDPDLVVGQEDGRVALIENTGRTAHGMPQFEQPQFFQQTADDLKCGVLVNPVAFDWDGDGDQDLICGDAAGYVSFIENLDGRFPPKWAAPRQLSAAGKIIRIQAGDNGSIQGPAEAKWGYTTLSVADWDHDGLADIVANSIWGKVVWYRNTGSRTSPELAAAQDVEVQWPAEIPKPTWVWWTPSGKQLATQWRTTPVVVDATGDGLNDLVMLDRDGFLALFERTRVEGQLRLLPPRHAFRAAAGDSSVFDNNQKAVPRDVDGDGVNDLAVLDREGRITFFTMNPMGNRELQFTKFAPRLDDPVYVRTDPNTSAIRLTGGWAGRSGRRKLTLTDWDGDGLLDVLVNSTNVTLLRATAAQKGSIVLKDMGPLDTLVLAGHDTAPATADWNRDGVPDLVVGAEDGFIYYLANPRSASGPAAAGARD